MTEIRIFKPENHDCPEIIFEEDLLTFVLNMSFGEYMVRYGSDTVRKKLPLQDFREYMFDDEEEGEGDSIHHDNNGPGCSTCGNKMMEIPRLVIKNKETQEILFNSPIMDNWSLDIHIREILKSKYNIKVNVYQDDNEAAECEICENNYYSFEVTSIVDRYSFDSHVFPKGPFMEHPPDPKEQLDDTVLEEMK